ncbi:MAG: hypothetical protein OEM91_04785, partial [Hyphomicrobiales bacterium]|nr:hypothetical protein [Hyphomicrobiales bacterium]
APAFAQAPRDSVPPTVQKPSLGVCMEVRERLDLSLASIGRELAVYLDRCLARADALSESGRKSANEILNAPKERKALFKAAGSVAVTAFKRALPVGGQELYEDFLESYTKAINTGLGKEKQAAPKICNAYFDHMASTLSGPREALIVVVVSRAKRFQPMFPDCER